MHRPFVIGIAGGSGSGKTTLARSLRDEFGPAQALRIEHDAYYHDLAHLDPSERAAVNFDHPRALDNDLLGVHLDALRAGRSVPEMRYCFATHTRAAVDSLLAPRPIVIVEGILLFSVASLRARFDLRVFVDAAADLRLVRRLRRDVAERGRTPESVCAQYLDSVRPMHEEFVEPAKNDVDVVVSGVGPIREATKAVLRAIEAGRTRRASGRQAVLD